MIQPGAAIFFFRAARNKVAKAKFSPHCAREIPEKTGDPAWRCQKISPRCARQIPEKTGDPAWQSPHCLCALFACSPARLFTCSPVCLSALTQCCPFALRATRLQKQNILRNARASYQRKQVTQLDVARNFLRAAHNKVAKAKFSPRCAREIPEKTGDPAWRLPSFYK